MSDADVLRLRDQMYALAQCVVAAYLVSDADNVEATVLASLPTDTRDDIEERAAIIQFDAHLPRGLAARAAVASRVTAAKKSR
jgi:hypothetical protein